MIDKPIYKQMPIKPKHQINLSVSDVLRHIVIVSYYRTRHYLLLGLWVAVRAFCLSSLYLTYKMEKKSLNGLTSI